MAVGGIPDAQESLVRRLPRPWKPEEVSELKARVPIRRNGWNTCAEVLNSWKFQFPLSVLFIFTLSLVSPQMQSVLSLAPLEASWLMLLLLIVFMIPTALFVIAENNKRWPPKWRRCSLGDFYKRYGEIAATAFFQGNMKAMPQNLPLANGLVMKAAFEIEYCADSTDVIVWRLLFDVPDSPSDDAPLQYREEATPVLVLDVKERRVLDPDTY